MSTSSESKAGRRLQALLILAFSVSAILAPARAQQLDPIPFECRDKAFVIQNNQAVLYEIDQSVSPPSFNMVAGLTIDNLPIEVNNLVFSRRDGLLYAVQLSAAGNEQIIRIDSNGTVFQLGRPDGLPAAPRFDSGDVSLDGSVMYITAHGQPLYMLPLPSIPEQSLPPVTSVPITGSAGVVHDWAVHPINGKLYGGDGTHGQVAVLDPATGIRTDFGAGSLPGLPPLPANGAFGAAWFDSLGQLNLYHNDGLVFRIDLVGPGRRPTVVVAEPASSSERNDGASCNDAPRWNCQGIEMVAEEMGFSSQESTPTSYVGEDPGGNAIRAVCFDDLPVTIEVLGVSGDGTQIDISDTRLGLVFENVLEEVSVSREILPLSTGLDRSSSYSMAGVEHVRSTTLGNLEQSYTLSGDGGDVASLLGVLKNSYSLAVASEVFEVATASHARRACNDLRNSSSSFSSKAAVGQIASLLDNCETIGRGPAQDLFVPDIEAPGSLELTPLWLGPAIRVAAKIAIAILSIFGRHNHDDGGGDFAGKSHLPDLPEIDPCRATERTCGEVCDVSGCRIECVTRCVEFF